MTFAGQLVFGALRDADELELDCALLGPMTGLSKGQYSAAVKDLRKAGIVRTWREGYRTFVALNQRPVRQAA